MHLVIAYFLILLLGISYSSNPSEGWLDFMLKITLLLWPLAMATWYELIDKYRNQLLIAFAITTSISALALVIIALINWQASGESINKLYLFTSAWKWIPNHYIALYASFGLLILLHTGLKGILKRWILIGCAIVLLVLVLLTSVRIQFLALPVALLTFLVFTSTHRKSLKNWAVAGIALLLVAAFAFPSSRMRIMETVDEIRSIEVKVNDKQTNHRVFLWRYGAKVIKENFWLGTGTGAADMYLNEKLKDCDAEFWNGHRTYTLQEKNYNYHNAFMQHFASHGVIGFLIFLLMFIGPFIYFGKNLSGLGAAFLVLTFIAFLTESMLERQAGVLFFSFFYSLLFVSHLRPRA